MVALVSPPKWSPLAAADDPYADHRPTTVECVLGLGWVTEPDGFEVNTDLCNYGAFGQETLVDIEPGATIKINFFHFDLLSPVEATAHAVVRVGDHLLFEREIKIPGKAEVWNEELVADFALPAGSPAVFHLHNHGQNTWTLGAIQVEVREESS